MNVLVSIADWGAFGIPRMTLRVSIDCKLALLSIQTNPSPWLFGMFSIRSLRRPPTQEFMNQLISYVLLLDWICFWLWLEVMVDSLYPKEALSLWIFCWVWLMLLYSYNLFLLFSGVFPLCYPEMRLLPFTLTPTTEFCLLPLILALPMLWFRISATID